MSIPGIIHIRGAYLNFLCEETFIAEYSLKGVPAQRHTNDRDNATCKKCIEVYDREGTDERR